jgi:integrase
MGWQHVVGDAIKVKQQKTGTTLLIPMHPELQEALTATERKALLFLTTGRGTAFSRQVFTKWFSQQCKLAGVHNRSAHGLRKSARSGSPMPVARRTRLPPSPATDHCEK